MLTSTHRVDAVDRGILTALTEDARQSAATIAGKVGLSPSAVRRRISRLQELGTIAGYTVVLDHNSVEPSLEAYVELTFSSATDIPELVRELTLRPEVREAAMLAGDPDAIMRLRVTDVDHLREVVGSIRAHASVTGSKTLIALSRVRHTLNSHQPAVPNP